MKKFIKTIFFIFLSIFILLLIVLVSLPYFFPMEKFRVRLEQEINNQITGKAEIFDLKLSTYPWLGARIEGLTIKNGQAFRESELFKVKNAGVRIKVLPLFQKKIIGEILIENPVIRFETLSDGQTSQGTILKPKTAPKPPGPTPKSDETKPSSDRMEKIILGLELKSLALTQGELRTIQYDQNFKILTGANKGIDIRHLDIHLENLTTRGEIPVRIQAALFNVDSPDLEFQGILNTDLDSSFSSGKIAIESSTLEMGDVRVTLQGNAEIPKNNPVRIDLQAQSKGINLAQIEKNLPFLKGTMPKGIQGELNVETKIVGPVDPFENLKIDISLDSPHLTMAFEEKVTLENTQFQATLHNKSVHLRHFKTQTFEGNIQSSGKIHLPKNTGPFLDLQTEIKEINLNLLTNAFLKEKDILFGKGHLKLSLAGIPSQKPASSVEAEALVPAWMKTKGEFSIGPGKIGTLNLMGDTVKTLMQIAPLDPNTKKQFEKVEWKKFEGNFSTEKGQLFLAPVTIDYGPAYYQMDGDVSPEKKLNFRGNVFLTKATVQTLSPELQYAANKKGEVVIPLRISGSVNRPIAYLDVKELAKMAAKRVASEVKETVTNEAKGMLKGLLAPPPDTSKNQNPNTP
jgi:AsmA protein